MSKIYSCIDCTKPSNKLFQIIQLCQNLNFVPQSFAQQNCKSFWNHHISSFKWFFPDMFHVGTTKTKLDNIDQYLTDYHFCFYNLAV